MSEENLPYEDLISGSLERLLGPSVERKESSKSPTEKVKSYTSLIADTVFWASRDTYLELIKNFLLKKINADTFTSKFFDLRRKNMKKSEELCLIIEDRILPIPDLYYTCKARDFKIAIQDLFFSVDLYDPSVDEQDWNDIAYNEGKLRSVIQKYYVPQLQDSCSLDDSFFQSV